MPPIDCLASWKQLHGWLSACVPHWVSIVLIRVVVQHLVYSSVPAVRSSARTYPLKRECRYAGDLASGTPSGRNMDVVTDRGAHLPQSCAMKMKTRYCSNTLAKSGLPTRMTSTM